MKSFKKFQDSRYEQGFYHPVNKDKYTGKIPIVYRSSWEKAAFWWLDNHSSCIKWGSESIVVNYVFQGKNRRYFVDLFAVVKSKDGGTKKLFIEVKPEKCLYVPVRSPRKKEKTFLQEMYVYKMNEAKWIAAKEFAKSRDAEFIVLTEKQLFKQ